jgi:hypothetical protein
MCDEIYPDHGPDGDLPHGAEIAEDGPGPTDRQLVELGQAIGITDPQFPETIRQGTYLPSPP